MSEVPEHRPIERLVSRATLEKLADHAEAFLKTYTPPHHIYQAMKEYSKDSADFRRELKQAIEKILRARAKKKKEAPAPAPAAHLVLLKGQRGDDQAELARDKARRLMADAYAHQIRQPADTYDIEAEEEIRKPI